MSSSVPAEDPLETTRHVKPPPHTTGLPTVTAVPVTAPAVTPASVSETALASGSSGPAAGHTSAFQQYVARTAGEEMRPPFIFNETVPGFQAPLGTTEQREAQESSTAFPSSSRGTSPTGTTTRALLPKGTRRTKAHVASACVNCKKKHLGCDPARPCRRCVLSGKEMTAATQSGIMPLTSGFSPVLNLGGSQMGARRAFSSYTHQGLPPTTSPPQYQQPFGVPMPPYTVSPRMVSRLPPGDTREAYPESPVRLPPIFPPAMPHSRPAPQAHRLSDPYPAVWSPRLREELMQPQPQQQTRGSSPHSLMEPTSSAAQTRHAALEHGHGEVAPHQSNSIIQGAQTLSVQSSPARPRDEQPAGGPETDEPRPAKRRKMALDDMVND
ncbi:hypothetical protein ACP6JC_008944 [Aspergillus fumigatus]